MAIQKTSATRLRKDSLPYTTLANRTVEQIKNTDALAIWAYLQTKPSGWVVRAGKIQSHFGIGRDKYRNAMAYLAEMKLVSYVSERDEKGHLRGTEIVIHCEPLSSESREPEKPTVGDGDTESLKNRPSDSPTVGESGPLVMEGNPSNGKSNSNDQRDALTEAFEMFWSAGMVKVGKAKAKAKFENLVHDRKEDPESFAHMLARDVKARLSAGVFGFDRLHPTTYLNGERWDDEIVSGNLPDNVHSFPKRSAPDPYANHSDCGGKVYIPGRPADSDEWRARR